MRSIWGLLAATAALLVGVSARAEEPQAKYEPRAAFAETDTNKDGAIDQPEFYSRIVEVYYHADGNKDGYLVEEEIGRLTFPDDMKTADTNGDGRISLNEFVRVRELDFQSADGNKDGTLSVEEVVEVYEVKGKK